MILDSTPSPSEEEEIAIASAIMALLRSERTATANGTSAGAKRNGVSWNERGWSFTGRLDIQGEDLDAIRVPQTAPQDAWTAAGRADRF